MSTYLLIGAIIAALSSRCEQAKAEKLGLWCVMFTLIILLWPWCLARLIRRTINARNNEKR